MSAGSAAALSAGAAQGDARRIGVLFMIGSACFAVASLPGASSVSDKAVGVIYFVGSIFFTTAASEQLRVARGEGKEAWAAGVQFAGTLFFNVTTFFGMYHHFEAHTSNLLVWSPDVFGSICFLASSVLAELAVLHAVLVIRRSATLNLVGSVAFGIFRRRRLHRPGHERADERLARYLDDAARRALLPLGGADPGEAAAVVAAEGAGRGAGAGRLARRGAVAVDDLVGPGFL